MNTLEILKSDIEKYHKGLGIDTDDYQYKKHLFATLLLANFKITPVFNLSGICKCDGGVFNKKTACFRDDLSVNKILEILLFHETEFQREHGADVRLDIDRMIDGIINNL